MTLVTTESCPECGRGWNERPRWAHCPACHCRADGISHWRHGFLLPWPNQNQGKTA